MTGPYRQTVRRFDAHPLLRRRCGGSWVPTRVPSDAIVAHDRRPRRDIHSSTCRRRSALPTTDSELKLIAAAAMMGLSSRPKAG